MPWKSGEILLGASVAIALFRVTSKVAGSSRTRRTHGFLEIK